MKAEKQQKKSFFDTFRRKNRQALCTFVVNAAGIDSTVGELQKLLLDSGYERKDALRLSFSLDALLFEWHEHGLKNAPAELFVEKVFGQKKLVVEVHGVIDDAGQEEFSQTFPLADSLKQNGLLWSSSKTRAGLRAELIISKKGIGSGVKFLIAVAAAVATVLVLSALPGDALAIANDMVFNPLFDIGVGLLTALIGPMVFFSIVAGIMGAGDIDTLKQLGLCTLRRIMQANALGLAFAVVGAVVIMRSSFSPASGTVDFGKELLNPLFGIVPTSFFQPFIDGNVLQIAVWGVIFGVAAILMRSRIPVVADAIFELNALFLQVIIYIARIMPVFIYLALVRIMSDVSSEMVAILLCLLVVFALSAVLVIIVSTALAARKRKIGFGAMVNTMLPTLATAFLTSSTAASYSLVCETLRKFSVEEPVVSFHAPIAVSIVHPGLILDFMLVTATATCLGGGTVSITQFILMAILCFILGVAAPSAPGGSIAVYALLFSSLGIDAASLPLFIAVCPIIDMMGTTLNVACIMTTALQVDSDLKERSEDPE